jgi:hypothetical protein
MVSIADNLLNFLISIITPVIRSLPINMPGISLVDFNAYFEDTSIYLLTAYNQISYFVPIKLLVGLIISVFIAEIILVGIRSLKYLFAQIRGSGA